MDIDYRGANTIVIKSKNGIIITDPTKGGEKIKEIMNPDAISLVTQDEFLPEEANFIIDMPGEYEKNNISIKGIPVQKYGEEEGNNSTIYKIVIDGVRIVVIGHTNSPISDDNLESIGIIDMMIVPISNEEYTLNARDAANIVRQFDAKVVIPTYHPTGETKGSLDEFLKELASFTYEKVDSLKIKNAQIPQVTTIYSLKKK